MKLILSFFLSIVAVSVFSQTLSNRRIFSLNIVEFGTNFYNASSYSNSMRSPGTKINGISLKVGASLGKINSKNIAISYGAQIIVRYEDSKQNSSGIGSYQSEYGLLPTVIFQKMLPLGNRVYFSPQLALTAGYLKYRGKVSTQNAELRNTVVSEAAINPLAFVWYFHPRSAVTLALGRATAGYSSITQRVENSLNDAKTVSNNFSIQARINDIQVGIQFLLN